MLVMTRCCGTSPGLLSSLCAEGAGLLGALAAKDKAFAARAAAAHALKVRMVEACAGPAGHDSC